MHEPTHRAQATVDLGAIRSNVELLRASAPTADLMAVVKADAYGHGLVASAAAARAGGAGWLGTALLEEALALRAAGDTGPVLAWLLDPTDPFDAAVTAGIDLSASAPWALAAAAAAARSTGTVARVHLKIDTGLGRGGSPKADWPGLLAAARTAAAEGTVEVVGIWSHLAHADAPAHPTIDAQVLAFEDAV